MGCHLGLPVYFSVVSVWKGTIIGSALQYLQ